MRGFNYRLHAELFDPEMHRSEIAFNRGRTKMPENRGWKSWWVYLFGLLAGVPHSANSQDQADTEGGSSTDPKKDKILIDISSPPGPEILDNCGSQLREKIVSALPTGAIETMDPLWWQALKDLIASWHELAAEIAEDRKRRGKLRDWFTYAKESVEDRAAAPPAKKPEDFVIVPPATDAPTLKPILISLNSDTVKCVKAQPFTEEGWQRQLDDLAAHINANLDSRGRSPIL